MQAINPICAETIVPHIGQTVCAVTRDGTHYYGTVVGVDGGNLILNGGVGPATISGSKKTSKKASTKAWGYPGYGYWGGYGATYALSLALLSLLFLVPFAW